MSQKILVFNRYTQQIEEEKIYGDNWMRFLYEKSQGQYIEKLVCKALFSKIYGTYQSHPMSASKVKNFILDYQINMDDYLPGSKRSEDIDESYENFNEFFIRKFKPEKRLFHLSEDILPAFSEARYLGYNSTDDHQTFPVKGTYLRAKDLLQNEPLAKVFDKGPLIIARLCPVDYHRFHFPDSGKIIDHYPIPGKLHSVNPIALRAQNDIFIKNERYVTILQTENFGKVAYIEVGAICVGKIVQTHNLKSSFKRGEEKGYFLFGGSTVIILGEKGKWKISDDICEKTNNKMETYIHLGDKIGIKI